MTISEIRDRWAARRNELFRLKASVDGATLCADILQDLDSISVDDGVALLTLKAASHESGFSTRQLARMIADGKLVDYGRKNAPRLKLSELPRKPRTEAASGAKEANSASMLQLARHTVAARSRMRVSV